MKKTKTSGKIAISPTAAEVLIDYMQNTCPLCGKRKKLKLHHGCMVCSGCIKSTECLLKSLDKQCKKMGVI